MRSLRAFYKDSSAIPIEIRPQYPHGTTHVDRSLTNPGAPVRQGS
jgi:hypothetical protein